MYQRYLNGKLFDKFQFVDRLSLNLDNLKPRLDVSFNNTTSAAVNKLAEYAAKLDALNPAKILLRGYSIAEKQGSAVKSVDELNIDDSITLKLSDGSAECKVISTERTKI